MDYHYANAQDQDTARSEPQPSAAAAKLPRLDALSWFALAAFGGYLFAGLVA